MSAVIPPPIQDFHDIFELLAIGLCLGLALDGMTKNSAVRLKAVLSRHNVSFLPKSLHHGVFFKRMKAPFSPSRLCILIKGKIFCGEFLLGLKRHPITKRNLARWIRFAQRFFESSESSSEMSVPRRQIRGLSFVCLLFALQVVGRGRPTSPRPAPGWARLIAEIDGIF